MASKKEFKPVLEVNQVLNEDIRLGKKDKGVLDAFSDKKSAESKYLSTDGKSLDGNWMGGTGIARWKGNKIEINDIGSRAQQTVVRALRKIAPANDFLKEQQIIDEWTFYEGINKDDPKMMGKKIDWKKVIVKIPQRDGKGDSFVIVHRDTKGMPGKQDQYMMYMIDSASRVILNYGSHPSLNGAKKFAKSRGLMEGYDVDYGGGGTFGGLKVGQKFIWSSGDSKDRKKNVMTKVSAKKYKDNKGRSFQTSAGSGVELVEGTINEEKKPTGALLKKFMAGLKLGNFYEENVDMSSLAVVGKDVRFTYKHTDKKKTGNYMMDMKSGKSKFLGNMMDLFKEADGIKEGFTSKVGGGKVPIGNFTFKYNMTKPADVSMVKGSVEAMGLKIVGEKGKTLSIDGPAKGHDSLLRNLRSLGVNGSVNEADAQIGLDYEKDDAGEPKKAPAKTVSNDRVAKNGPIDEPDPEFSDGKRPRREAVTPGKEPSIEKTPKGYQVYVWSPKTKGYIPQGQPHGTMAKAQKDLKNFYLEAEEPNVKAVDNSELPTRDDELEERDGMNIDVKGTMKPHKKRDKENLKTKKRFSEDGEMVDEAKVTYDPAKMKALAKKDKLIARMVKDGRTLEQLFWSEVHGDSAMERSYMNTKNEGCDKGKIKDEDQLISPEDAEVELDEAKFTFKPNQTITYMNKTWTVKKSTRDWVEIEDKRGFTQIVDFDDIKTFKGNTLMTEREEEIFEAEMERMGRLIDLDEERKSRTDKDPEKWRIVAKIKGGKEFKSKWFIDFNDAYDALGPFVSKLSKKYGGVADGNKISPELFAHRYIQSNKKMNEHIQIDEARTPHGPTPKFKLKFPKDIDGLTMKFLYLGMQNGALHVLDDIEDRTGSITSPIYLQVVNGWLKIKPMIEKHMKLTGQEALDTFMPIVLTEFLPEAPFLRTLYRKYKLNRFRY